MKQQLIDGHGRIIDYVRFAVTDRCNLRCFYCMPEEGIKYEPRKELLTYEELLRIYHLLASLGVRKVRITGGEPFLRKDLITFLKELYKISPTPNIHVTTNGTLTEQYISQFKSVGIQSVNLSLDSLDKDRFFKITRRDELETVMSSFHQLIEHDIRTKINMVVMGGLNDQDIIPMLELAKKYPVDVRFIEEMPFNGTGIRDENKYLLTHRDIFKHIESTYSSIKPVSKHKNATADKYHIDGFKGSVGIIAAYSRTFCGTCNRIRITPTGLLKTCLYDQGVFNIRDMIRSEASDEQLLHAVQTAVLHKAKDGFTAEANRLNNFVSESMATIGG